MNSRTATALTGPHADFERIVEPLLKGLGKLRGGRALKLAAVCYKGYASVRFFHPDFERHGHDALDPFEGDVAKEIADLLMRNGGSEPLTHDQIKDYYSS